MAELSPDAQIARYRIVCKIGAGGMGEVYRAHDTELGRPVAVQFLPDDVAAHQSRVKRFIQEAKAASALNHPNILTVYDIGPADDTTFIATEFVDGVTLRRHMRHRLKLLEVPQRRNQGHSPNCDFTTTARHSVALYQGGEAATNRLLRQSSHNT